MAITKFSLIFSFVFISFSCSKENPPSLYEVRIKNAYFEVLDSVKLGNHNLGSIEKNKTSKILTLGRGVFPFSCKTKSKLIIQGDVDIKGLNNRILIKLNEKGKIKLE